MVERQNTHYFETRHTYMSDRLKLALFSSALSTNVMADMKIAGIKEAYIPHLLTLPPMKEAIEKICERPQLHTFQLGLLGSLLTVDKLPRGIIEVLQPTPSSGTYRVHTAHETWSLCDLSEKKMHDAQVDNVCIALGKQQNPELLIKPYGKPAALALDNFISPGGETIVRGNWYAPVGPRTLPDIEDAFIKNETTISEPKGAFALMRAVTSFNDIPRKDFVDKCRDYALTLPTLPKSSDVPDEEYMRERKVLLKEWREQY